MTIILVTGSAGLIGSESVRFFCDRGYTVVGIDNNMRQTFFGENASTKWNRDLLLEKYEERYIHHNIDIRDREGVTQLFQQYGTDISLIIHTAAQPSHDWAARDPYTDFTVNANGTLVLLENTRQVCPNAVFIFCSTNKVYGDKPNFLPLVEQEWRWEIEETHSYSVGIDETMCIDQCKHSLFGASKVAADVLVQEYGRYFDMKTASFRGGCLTGPSHSGTELHGFLSYLMKCTMLGKPYRVYGYKGKQVRDNIHSYDLVNAFYHFYQDPRVGEVYNIGGSRFSNCSILEAIQECEAIAEKKLNWSYEEVNRSGDHIWWISDVRKFQQHYPSWELTYGIKNIIKEIYIQNTSRWN
ncbi:NAD-dependent epimerase/dehydratase family protein [Chroococcidiopsis sp. FACHB-1243]|uniref:NAD-dependent epimerase/dehydratase family protein n=1 Tax=Chroococcidiopsis sp. [FACHB-1243] TaxID=2692781 RepID=UPI00177C0E9E|nr:NAD-dependent epimerase/dehydratase family protein [Chroococcidiopsis sp. [FACHB-1243]]MBD2305287.1 NAD-dependent epimerase/dehydratase family protein [Chroococcidiopsis sp. [FACHB-1243]]